MEWPAAFAWKAPPRALRRLCTKKRPAVFAAGRFFQWLMKLYEETLLLVRIRLCLQAEGLVPGLNDLELGHPAVGMEAVVVVVADMEIFVLDAPLCSLLQVGVILIDVAVGERRLGFGLVCVLPHQQGQLSAGGGHHADEVLQVQAGRR